MSNVLILFQTNNEPVEQLALSVAVGAVEAGGLIRLRRLAGSGAPEVGHKSYGKLQPADLLWANAIIIGLEDAVPNSEELDPLLELLLQAPMSAKQAWTFGQQGPDAPPTQAQLQVLNALQAADVTILSLGSASDSADLISRMKQCGHLTVLSNADF